MIGWIGRLLERRVVLEAEWGLVLGREGGEERDEVVDDDNEGKREEEGGEEGEGGDEAARRGSNLPVILPLYASWDRRATPIHPLEVKDRPRGEAGRALGIRWSFIALTASASAAFTRLA